MDRYRSRALLAAAPTAPLRWAGEALRQIPLDGHPFAGRELLPRRPHLIKGIACWGWFIPFPQQPVEMGHVVVVLQLGAAFCDHGSARPGSLAAGTAERGAVGDAMPEAVVQIECSFDGVAGQVVCEAHA